MRPARRTPLPRTASLALALVAPLALVGCASQATEPDAATAPDSTRAGAGEAPDGDHGAAEGDPAASASAGSGAGASPSAPASTTGESCGERPDDPRIAAAIAQVPSAFASGSMASHPWMGTALETSFDPCAALSSATITVEGATGSSPMQVLLFHRGEYLGTTSDCAPGFQLVEQLDGDTVAVTYQWPKEGQPNAGEKWSETVEYSWSASGGVTMAGRIPLEAINESICHTWPPVQ